MVELFILPITVFGHHFSSPPVSIHMLFLILTTLYTGLTIEKKEQWHALMEMYNGHFSLPCR
jgi:hypothetical protein